MTVVTLNGRLEDVHMDHFSSIWTTLNAHNRAPAGPIQIFCSICKTSLVGLSSPKRVLVLSLWITPKRGPKVFRASMLTKISMLNFLLNVLNVEPKIQCAQCWIYNSMCSMLNPKIQSAQYRKSISIQKCRDFIQCSMLHLVSLLYPYYQHCDRTGGSYRSWLFNIDMNFVLVFSVCE